MVGVTKRCHAVLAAKPVAIENVCEKHCVSEGTASGFTDGGF